MAEDDDDAVARAGEYVLGTLSADERSAFLRLLAHQPALVEAVRDWQERLAPLGLNLPPVEPPASLFPRIAATIDAATVGGARAMVASNDNRVARWRATSLVAGVAALIAGGLALRPAALPPVQSPVQPPIVAQPVAHTSGVAALTAAGTTPALIVTHDRRTGELELLPVNLPNDTLHSFQLWAIKGKAAPRPIGLIESRRAGPQHVRLHDEAGVTLAISREPIGGSPTGLPTGPVLYTGKLLQVPQS